MFKNYFKIAWTNVVRQKLYALINVAGLAVGIAACLLIFVIVNFEMSYDKFQTNYKQIYRLVKKETHSDGVNFEEGMPGPVAEALRIDFPQVKGITQFFSSYNSQITLESGKGAQADKKFLEETGVLFTEPKFAEIFNIDWLAGNAAVLNEPNNIVLDKQHAEKYFGSWQDALGKTVKMDNSLILKVAGVVENSPVNSDFPFKLLISLPTVKANQDAYGYTNNWFSNTSNNQIYMLLPPNVTSDYMDKQLDVFSKKHFGEKMSGKKELFLQPLSELHFDKRFGHYGDHITNKNILLTLSLIGFFIVLMASINFVNLATAQAVRRSKEIGIRKVLGSGRKQLILQIISETGFIVLFACLLSFLIGKIALPYLKNVADVPSSIGLFNISNALFLAAVFFVVTLFAGTYPALILSGFKPVLALKSKITSATIGGVSLRRGLVVTQFAISQFLIIGTIVAVRQMNYVRNADLGFNKDAILMVPNINDSIGLTKLNTLKNQLQQIADVKSVSFAFDPPSSNNNWGSNFYFNGSSTDPGFEINVKQGDADYFKTFELTMLAGRPYEASDTLKEIVINETLVKKLGLKNANEAIGKTIMLSHKWLPITGVVKDFKSNSLRSDIKPIAMFSNKKFYSQIALKIQTGNMPRTLSEIKDIWQHTFPDYVYDAKFLDERIAAFYKQEDQLELVYKIFAGIALFISCLGLYGLVSFMVVQKTKEVGIRKVLGASVRSIVFLFSKEFTILVLLSFAIAAPIAYVLMKQWLQNFAFRINMSILFFITAISVSIIIAWLTVGIKAVRAALVNPVKSLKTE
ncbi:ABC transporter permease [Chitinophagaceae bacterium LWZ2-11]